MAKLSAFRQKEHNFVAAPLDAGLVDSGFVAARLGGTPDKHLPATERALSWQTSRESS